MTEDRRNFLTRLRPREDAVYVSQSRTVLATGRDGFVPGDSPRACSSTRPACSHITGIVSVAGPLRRSRCPMSNNTPGSVTTSPPPPSSALGGSCGGVGEGRTDAVQQTIKLRLTRMVGDGVHEDVDLTNFTQQPVAFTLALEVDADFADQEEAGGQRQQQRTLTRHWREAGGHAWELVFDYRAEQRSGPGRALCCAARM